MVMTAETVCSMCGHINLHGALLCANCHGLLVEPQLGTDVLASSTVKPVDTGELNIQPSRRKVALPSNSIALFVEENPAPIVLVVIKEAVLGRYSMNGSLQPRVDLNHFGARDKGVSRLHAAFRRNADRSLMLEDLGSTNGSWVNDARLEPYAPTPVKPRDVVRLGRLWLEIYFES